MYQTILSTHVGYLFDEEAPDFKVKYEEAVAQAAEAEKQRQELLAELEATKVKASKNKELQDRITQMQTKLRTAEEQAKHEAEQLRTASEQRIVALEQEAKLWKQNYVQMRSTSDLMAAINDGKPVNANQVFNIMTRSAVSEPKLNDQGEPTGEFETFVEIGGVKMTPAKAVEHMKADKDNWNLWLDTSKAGPNIRKSDQSVNLVELAKDPAAWAEYRKNNNI